MAARIVMPLALATVLVSAIGAVTGLVLVVRAPADVIPVGYRPAEMLPFLVFQLSFTVVGALVAWRRPENRIGWMLCGTSVVSTALTLLAGMVVDALAAEAFPRAATAAWISSWLMLGIGVTLGPALATFPDGRVTSRAAALAVWLLAITVVLAAVAIALRPGPLPSFPSIANPFAWRDHRGALDAVFAAGMLAGLLATAFGIGSHIVRFRLSSGPERQQMKWFLSSAAVIALGLIPVVALTFGVLDPTAGSTQAWMGRTIGALSSAALPIAIGVAILRHRLYDIDVLIRRTLVYASVSAVLVTIYVAAVVFTGAILRPFTAGSDLAVAVSTLLVVALFQPIRTRIHDLVDRRFYRSRYDAARTLDAFGARLRHEVELGSVQADLLGVVGETVRPAHASLWLRGR